MTCAGDEPTESPIHPNPSRVEQTGPRRVPLWVLAGGIAGAIAGINLSEDRLRGLYVGAVVGGVTECLLGLIVNRWHVARKGTLLNSLLAVACGLGVGSGIGALVPRGEIVVMPHNPELAGWYWTLIGASIGGLV